MSDIHQEAKRRWLESIDSYECCGGVWKSGSQCLGINCPVEKERRRVMTSDPTPLTPRPDGWYWTRVNESPWRCEFIRANTSDYLYYTEILPIPTPERAREIADRLEAAAVPLEIKGWPGYADELRAIAKELRNGK